MAWAKGCGGGKEKGGERGQTGERKKERRTVAAKCASAREKILQPAFNPHPENNEKKKKKGKGRARNEKKKEEGEEETRVGVEEEEEVAAVYGMKSSFHVGVKVGRRMGNEAQQRLAPGFG